MSRLLKSLLILFDSDGKDFTYANGLFVDVVLAFTIFVCSLLHNLIHITTSLFFTDVSCDCV